MKRMAKLYLINLLYGVLLAVGVMIGISFWNKLRTAKERRDIKSICLFAGLLILMLLLKLFAEVWFIDPLKEELQPTRLQYFVSIICRVAALGVLFIVEVKKERQKREESGLSDDEADPVSDGEI